MKKKYTSSSYKLKHIRRIKQLEEKKKKRALKKSKLRAKNRILKRTNKGSQNPYVIYAPDDFRLMENTEKCLSFFREVRRKNNIFFLKGSKVVFITLKFVNQIDPATINVLSSISDDLKLQNIVLSGDFPDDLNSRDFLEQSGFLNRMVDGNNKKFKTRNKSDIFCFEKGEGKQTEEERKKISDLVKDVVEHLTESSTNIKPVKSVLLEICANSIEHAGTRNNQWLLGVMFEKDKVVFTVSDVGRGILETLYFKFGAAISNYFFKSRVEVLMKAFEQKYDSTNSSTQETNRNKGLPSIRENFNNGIIKNLIVLTNDVVLHFGNPKKSKVLKRGTARLKGTLYQWELTKECIINTIKISDERN